MNTLQQIQALQKQLEQETTCAEFLQSDEVLNSLLLKHKNRIHQMMDKPLYTCKAWVSFDATKDLLKDLQALFERKINTVSGSGFWRYTCIPDTEKAVQDVVDKDNKFLQRRYTEAVSETSTSGTDVSFFILVNDTPVKIRICFSYQSKDFVVPYLRENYYYTKNGQHGLQYLGVNGASDFSSCIGQYGYGDLLALLPKEKE